MDGKDNSKFNPQNNRKYAPAEAEKDDLMGDLQVTKCSSLSGAWLTSQYPHATAEQYCPLLRSRLAKLFLGETPAP